MPNFEPLPATDSSVAFGTFRLDLARRLVWHEGQLLRLAPKAVDVLVVLVEQAGQVVPKPELLERAWPDAVVAEANLSVNVALLRKGLGLRPDGGAWIETVPRRGYRFVGPVERRLTPGPPSLAVLPLRALGLGEDGETLGLALADAIIARLAGRSGWRVRPTSAVLSLAGSAGEPREAARALRVTALIEGTVQREHERLRVRLQFVPADETGPWPQWAEEIDVAFTSVFDLQDAVAGRAATALARATQAPTAPAPEQRPTLNGLAYQACLRGRHYWSRFTGPDLQRACECFLEALDRDPAYARPCAGLADVHLVLGFSGLVTPREAWPLALGYAQRALERDPQLAEAHVALGFVRLFDAWDWRAAGEELERAVQLDPEASAPRHWRAAFRLLRGDLAGAGEDLQAAEERDPLSVAVQALHGLRANLAGDREAERRACQQALELAPQQFLGHWGLGLAEQHGGRFEAAVAAHRQALELAPESPFLKGVLARSLALAGEPEKARRLLDESAPSESAAAAGAYARATALLALDEPEAALVALETAAEARNPWLVLLGIDPMLEPLRGLRRFEALREQVCPGVGARAARAAGPPEKAGSQRRKPQKRTRPQAPRAPRLRRR